MDEVFDIVHSSYADQIASVLENDILNDKYEPGERIKENDLVARFKVSRSPLREALQKLEFEGFLAKEPNKGYTVAKVTSKDVWDIFQIRANLESLAVSLAVQEQNRNILERLEYLHAQMRQAAYNFDSYLYYHLNSLFHQTFHEGSNNKKLQFLLQKFDKQIQRYRKEYFKTSGQMQRSLYSHATLIQYFKENKPQQAEQFRKETLLQNAKILVESLRLSEHENPKQE